MSLYKPTQDEIEKHSLEISDFLSGKNKESELIENLIKNQITVPYDKLNDQLIELRSKRPKTDKYYNYKESLNRLQLEGFDDHLPIQTYMHLRLSSHKYKSNIPTVIQDISISEAEFARELIEVTDKSIIIYECNKNLLWNQTKYSYEKPDLNLINTNMDSFSREYYQLNFFNIIKFVRNIPDKTTIKLEDLARVKKPLAERLYTKEYERIISFNRNATVQIPPVGEIRALRILNNFNIESNYVFCNSRGWKKL